MGHRLSKIYTRTGDDGSTGLGDGSRVGKDDPRIEAIGTVDELNSAIGLLLVEPLPEDIRACLSQVQHTLFDLGGELSVPGRADVSAQQISDLEQILERLNADLPPLQEFIMPGGSHAAATCHMARAICRRAERRVYSLSPASSISATSLAYLNRLSDLLFVIARTLNKADDVADIEWRR